MVVLLGHDPSGSVAIEVAVRTTVDVFVLFGCELALSQLKLRSALRLSPC